MRGGGWRSTWVREQRAPCMQWRGVTEAAVEHSWYSRLRQAAHCSPSMELAASPWL